MKRQSLESLDIFTTCPPYRPTDADSYLKHVREVSRWSDEAGCAGMLVYTDNGMLDPWLLSQVIIENTTSLMPLVAVQPAYMHPYTVAKAVTTLSYLHRRRVCLNMVAGGFKNDLLALNDHTPHDRRYDRLVEYTLVIKALLSSTGPVSFAGEFYRIERVSLTPPLPPELFPRILASGSSEVGMAAASAMAATAVKYPEPAATYEPAQESPALGIRVGIIARENEDEAWRVAHQRFPEDRKGQLTHQLAMKVSDSVWHQRLSRAGNDAARNPGPYWLVPFQNYKTNCPYLVGSYDVVGAEIRQYETAGFHTYIMDVPATDEDLHHIALAFTAARSVEQPFRLQTAVQAGPCEA